MEFREESKLNIVYISSIDKARDKEKIKQIWNIEEDLFESRLAKSEITRLVENRILKKDEGKFKANFHSQAFIDELKVFMEERKYEALKDIEKPYLKFIREDDVREKLFAPEEIKKYYHNNLEDAQKNPMHLFTEIAEILFIKTNSTDSEYSLEDQDYDQALLDNIEETLSYFEN